MKNIKTDLTQAKLGLTSPLDHLTWDQRPQETSEPRRRLWGTQLLYRRDFNSEALALKFNALHAGLRPLACNIKIIDYYYK